MMVRKERKNRRSHEMWGWHRTGGFMIFSVLLALGIAFSSAPPAIAADCPDGDSDSYVVCNGCDVPSGKSCGDCDDGNAAIYPGAVEVCNGEDDDCDNQADNFDPERDGYDPIAVSQDGPHLDEDGDGDLDEGLGYCVYATSGPADECKTVGWLDCKEGVETCVNLRPEHVLVYSPEGGPGHESCYNGVDDDCDGKVDLDDEQCCTSDEAGLCNGLDDDCNGTADDFPLGTAGDLCSDGLGVCMRTGIFGCNGDGTDVTCSVTAGLAKKEGSNYGRTCDNEKDDDCDGDTDLFDDDCELYGQSELCDDDIDNDGDGVVDEGFPTIGLPCATVETGACRRIGEIVCDGAGTTCDAVAGDPSEESTSAGNCGDSIDNDCDGDTDVDDADCASEFADLGVTCSLPYILAKPGKDCTGKHIIEFEGGQATTVTAELFALDVDGTMLDVREVQAGDEAHLASRLAHFRWSTKTNRRGARHTVYAPVPLLRVTGTNAVGVKDVAYCSILPYLEVTEPKGVTISLSEGTDLDVGAYLPLVDVDTLDIQLNGISVLDELPIDPATDFPTNGSVLCGSPGDCVFQIEAGCDSGEMVNVEILNLVVEGQDTDDAPTAREGVETPDQVNTMSFTVSGLPPGGHIFYITGDPLPLPKNLASQCNEDDLTDTGTASAFGIVVDSPVDQEIVASAPVYVQGTACGGNEITSLKINGKDLAVTIPPQTCTEGDGMYVPKECVIDFNEPMEQRTVTAAVAGNAPIGTYLAGPNRIIADAIDDQGNRTFNTDTIFALGPVQQPGYATAVMLLTSEVDSTVQHVIKAFGDEIDPAFVAGLQEEGAQDFFNEICSDAIVQFTTDLQTNLVGKAFGTIDVEPDCSCNIYDVPLTLRTLDFTYWDETATGTPTCEIDFKTDLMDVTVHLPSVQLNIRADDSCEDAPLGVCFVRTVVYVVAEVDIENILFEYTITEDAIETKTPSNDFVFTMNVRDYAGHDFYESAGTCSGGPDAGDSCYVDGQCGPPETGNLGECATDPPSDPGDSPPAGAACNNNGDCPMIGFGNRCFGGDNDGKQCTGDDDCPGEDAGCHGKCKGTCDDVVKNNEGDDKFNPIKDWDIPIECWGAWICTIFDTVGRAIAGAFAWVFTGGDFDIKGFIMGQFGVGGFQFEQAFLDSLQLTDPDPFGLEEMGLSPEKLGEEGNSEVTIGENFVVEIEDGGLTVAIPAVFGAPCESPENVPTPGAALSPATPPTVSQTIAASAEATLMIADDVFGQIFAGMKMCGDLNSFCMEDKASEEDPTYEPLLTFDDLLAEDCSNLFTPKGRGICQAIRDGNCDGLTGYARGHCYGFLGLDCTSLIANAAINACEATPARNIRSDHALRICGKVDMEPRLSILEEDASDDAVGTDLLLQQASVVFLLDRGADGYTGNLSDLHGCSSAEGDAALDCRIYAACLDLTLQTEMSINNSTCDPDQVGFEFKLLEGNPVVPQISEIGVMCNGGADNFGTDLLAAALETIVVKVVANNAEAFAPTKCADGLTLGGILNFESGGTKMFGVKTGPIPGGDDAAEPGFADYLGITVGLEPPSSD